MKELKKHTSISEQVALLKKRGLAIDDDSSAEEVLFSVNYYRLSGYLHNFKDKRSDKYSNGLSWRKLKRMYDFDRKFTRLLLFALEDIEETLKTRISYIITSHYTNDPLIYLKPQIYRDYTAYIRFLSHFYSSKENNKSLPFVEHHNKLYGGFLPMWVAVELLTMGNLHAIFDNLISKYQKEIAKAYGTGSKYLSNWIKNLTYTRNHLAHYMRVYNFNFGRTPIECKHHRRNFCTSNMIFDQIFVISNMYSDKEEWNNYIVLEIKSLLDEYSDVIELSGLGLPENWEDVLKK